MCVILTTILCAALASCGGAPAAEPSVTVEDARVTLPVIRGRPGAGYFTLRAGSRPLRIAGVASPRVERIELHAMNMAGGVMRMGPLEDRSVPAGGEVRFEPAGRHAMIFGPDPSLKPGDRIPLTFTFDGAPAVTVHAEVQGPGGGHGGH